jgi:hypothetical protein
MRKLVWSGMVVVAAAVSQGCYTYVPLDTESPPLGQTIALQITDRGRVELSDRFGPGLARIEGLVTSADSQDVVMNVFQVAHVDGLRSHWSGETVRVQRGYVGRLEERRLSRARTYLLAGAAAGAVAGLVASQGLFGWFSGDDPVVPPDDPVDSRVPLESRVWTMRLFGFR